MSLAGRRLPYAFARANGVLAGDIGGEVVDIWYRHDQAGGPPLAALGELARVFDRPLRPQAVDTDEFERRLAAAYAGGEQSAAEVASDIGQDLDIARLVEELPPVEDLLDAQHDAPIIRMINALLTQAARENASDIHIEPYERESVVRFRLDGVLHDVVSPKRALHAAMVSRIKIMAGLDIAEKRLPQDGRIGVRIAGRGMDVRVSTLPSSHGERVVLRLLDKDPARLDLSKLGMGDDTLARIDALIRQPHGILLVTGPTGSGKTTTLYAALSRLDARRLNIMTVEDPVEYDLPGIGQIQVNPRIDMSFAKALRAILRQDPDVVMIGEIRDAETAQIAVQASLTGHLVLATLHTNDAASAATRLTDMGIEPFLLSSSLLGVLAQRLVRRLCPHCRQPGPAAVDAGLPAEIGRLWQPVGCPQCAHTGYLGRLGLYELLEVDDGLRPLIHQQAGERALREAAGDPARGARALRLLGEDGRRWLRSGDTSLAELLRVTRA
ncbi:MAG: type II secretion system ATPase GspE [Azonexaceae bacterium]|uniref:type II secretion system ATPase GspE n=1 Tax=Azonexus sp. R2A61 TaxID=2744443 RepID=UPI001F311957|nr:type II secretion system ATPase GspE [Azonexaceae bacterium]